MRQAALVLFNLCGALTALGFTTAPPLRNGLALRRSTFASQSWRPDPTFRPSRVGGAAVDPSRRPSGRATTTTTTMGLFGLGAPEIAVIVAVAAFVLGPEKLAGMAKDAGKGLGEMKDVPAGFNEGFQEGASSEETKAIARSLGATTSSFKDTAADMAGEYKEVATEFSKGIKEGAQGVSKEVVSGLEATNEKVGEVRGGIKDLKTAINEAEIVEDAPEDAPNRTGSA